jgi:CBS domain-containing protein
VARLAAPPGESPVETKGGPALLAQLARGEGGSLRRISPRALLVRVFGEGEGEGWARLGVAPKPLVQGDGGGADSDVRIVVVVCPPRAEDGRRGGSLEKIARALGDAATESRLLAARSPEEARGLRPLMDAELIGTLRVEHVLTPLEFHVFPETPLSEVVESMARRGLQALPVVGEDLRVLGLVTAGEALRFALQRPGKGKKGSGKRAPAKARDVMSRSVMCVSEEEELVDAAQLMINKDADQLPVIRAGEIVGILTRDSVLAALFWDR